MSREFLDDLYWNKWLSTRQIAKIVRKSQTYVVKIMHGLDIQMRADKKVLRVEITPKMLTTRYEDRRMSIPQIAKELGVSAWAVHQRMIKFGIPRRKNGEATMKRPKPPFSGDPVDKAYLLGLRDDLSAQLHGKRVRIQLGTTHPTMIELFKAQFERYGHVCICPDYHKSTGIVQWHLHADLDASFSFLMRKPQAIETETIENDELFLSFLAGYTDAEGSFIISHSRDHATFILRICSQNIGVLKGIHGKLQSMSYHPTLVLEAKAGTKKGYSTIKRDYWRLELCRKNEVLSLIQSLPIKHKEKEKIQQLMFETKTDKLWREVKDRVRALHTEINVDVKRCVFEATSAYQRNHVDRKDLDSKPVFGVRTSRTNENLNK